MRRNDRQLGGDVRNNTVSDIKCKSSSPAASRARLPLLFAAALVVNACGPGEQPIDTLECGDGTEERNGVCVAIVDPIASCGEGTIYDEASGKCEPTIRCGDGTVADPETGECLPAAECGPGTELDLASGECIPVASCGPGTIFNDAIGACVSEASCGAGTVLEQGECVAVGVCADGSVLNLDSGLCESNTACGPAQVLLGGQCLQPNVAVGLEADTFEPAPDVNDPLFGGTPAPLTLEPVGEKTVFVGNIGRPADLGGNGILAQDRDTWSFTGEAGQYLSVSVLGTGLPQPAFILEGPKGYRRVSALLSTNDTSREVVLPYSGSYELTVVPSAFLTTDLPVGGTNAGYVGVIEEIQKPTPTSVAPSADPAAPTVVNGGLRDLSDNFYLVTGAAGDAVSLVFENASPSNPPAILAFDASGALVSHVDVDFAFGAWVGTLVKDEAGTTVVVDWQVITAADDAYTLQAAKIPHVQGAQVIAGTVGGTTTTDIEGQSRVAFTVSLAEPVVLEWDVDRTTSPDVQILGAGASVLVPDEDAALFYADVGSYTFFVLNDDDSLDTGASLTWNGNSVIDLGPLDPAAPSEAEASGGLLSPDVFGPRAAWMVAHMASDGLLRVVGSVALGEPEVRIYSPDGTHLTTDADPQFGMPMHAVADAGPMLIRVEAASAYASFGWQIKASALPPPRDLDAEPNDTIEAAIDLGALPSAVIGSLEDGGAIDVYKLTLDEPLASGQVIEIQLESITNTLNSLFADGAFLTLHDESNTQIASSIIGASTDLNNVIMHLSSAETQSGSTFYVRVTNPSSSGYGEDDVYLLRARVVEKALEVEPNNSVDAADAAEGMPAEWAAHWQQDDVADVFSFTLDDAVPVGVLLRVRVDTLTESLGDSDVTLTDSAGTVVAFGSHEWVELLLPGLAADQYFLTVVGPTTKSQLYQVRVDLIQAPPVEVEPNDEAAAPMSLGTLADVPLLRFGEASTTDEDWFAIELDQPLADDEGVRVRCLNVVDSTVLWCELHDITDPSAPVLLSQSRDDEATTTVSSSSTALAVRVAGTSSTADRYLMQVERGPTAEKEPNNDAVSAHPIGVLASGGMLFETANVLGDDEDWFSFTLDQDVPADAGIWLVWDNISDASSMDVELYDITDSATPVKLAFKYDDTGTLVHAALSGRVYGVRVEGSSTTANDMYTLSVELGPRAETEPNDTSETATSLGELPASIHGIIGNDTLDLFTFSLPTQLSATELVEVHFVNLDTSDDYNVILRNAGGEVAATTSPADDVSLQTPLGAAAGTYEVQIDRLDRTTSITGTELYRLDIRVVDTTITP